MYVSRTAHASLSADTNSQLAGVEHFVRDENSTPLICFFPRKIISTLVLVFNPTRKHFFPGEENSTQLLPFHFTVYSFYNLNNEKRRHCDNAYIPSMQRLRGRSSLNDRIIWSWQRSSSDCFFYIDQYLNSWVYILFVLAQCSGSWFHLSNSSTDHLCVYLSAANKRDYLNSSTDQYKMQLHTSNSKYFNWHIYLSESIKQHWYA